jgi:hypothetical protein
MVCKHLLRLLSWIGTLPFLLLSPLSAHAQTPTPPQYINASSCVFNNNVTGMYVVGPYLYGSGGTAYCNLTRPVHNYGEALPALNSVHVSGYSLQGGSVSTQVCRTSAYGGPAQIDCGVPKVSSNNFYDQVELPPPPASPPTGYFLWVTLNQPFAALSGLVVTWNR